MKILRTPDNCFANLEDFPCAPNYAKIGDGLRVAYIDEGDKTAPPVLLMHGEPTWSYLYRFMILPLVRDGFRVLAPDLIGFGRSDKPSEIADYSYRRMVAWMTEWLFKMNLPPVNLFCQDWGSLIGLRIAAENEEKFARIVLSNGGLPVAETSKIPKTFKLWKTFAKHSPWFPIGKIVGKGTARALSESEIAAYDAPFPDATYKAGARAMPLLVPVAPDNPAVADNRRAREIYQKWTKPFLTAFSDKDPITRGADRWFRENVPGAKNLEHPIIKNAGHFVQEDAGEELARLMTELIRRTS